MHARCAPPQWGGKIAACFLSPPCGDWNGGESNGFCALPFFFFEKKSTTCKQHKLTYTACNQGTNKNKMASGITGVSYKIKSWRGARVCAGGKID